MTSPITLIRPDRAWLPAYEQALARGWSPHTDRDVSGEQLRQLRQLRDDPGLFLHDLYHSPTVQLPDGSEAPRLPARDFWISDGEFCGRIGFRFMPGTETLPPSAMGHIGYTIVPWKQRRGYGTEALRLILPVARAEGFLRVLVTCDDDNIPSQKVIRANGGVPSGSAPHPGRKGHVKLLFWVPTTDDAQASRAAT